MTERQAVKCCYCDQTLLCDTCGREYVPSTAAEFQSLYQRECPVYCPICETVLRCRACGAVYSGAEEEFSDQDRE